MANRVEINATAPDFNLVDWQGQSVCLSDFRGRYHVILVFNRGFI
jgi:peroxiredoxin